MEIQDRVKAKSFVLVDDEGEPVAYLTGRETGFIGVTIAAAGGTAPLIGMGVTLDGTPHIQIHRVDEQGQPKAAINISITEDGRGTIRFEDADGAKRTMTT